jgi:hypothetical protein
MESCADLEVGSLGVFDSPALNTRRLNTQKINSQPTGKAASKPQPRQIKTTIKAENGRQKASPITMTSARKGTGRKKTKPGDTLLHSYFCEFDTSGTETLSQQELERLLLECALQDVGPPANSKYALFSPMPRGSFDAEGNGRINLVTFAKYFQVCKRCTIAKEKMHGAKDKQTSGGLDLAVIVRKMPVDFEGDRIRSCNHYQWIWCPGVPGNQKCKGSNRHDSCPKYLAKSTFWKHTKKAEGSSPMAGVNDDSPPPLGDH